MPKWAEIWESLLKAEVYIGKILRNTVEAHGST
jgi:hypothetical protein